MPGAVVLHSGGLDSTVCLLQAKERFGTVVSLGVDYGQRHRIELEYAAYQCKRFGARRKVIRIEWDRLHKEIPLDRDVNEMRESVSPAFLAGRNMIFLALGSAEAASIGAEELWVGVNSLDYSGYPDCRPEFIEAFSTTLELGIPGGPLLRAPLQHLTKPEIARQAQRLGLSPGDTWSCYSPSFGADGLKPCGRCDACRLHAYAWQEISVEDRASGHDLPGA